MAVEDDRPNPFEFCQHVEKRLRCVARLNHSGKHDLQPLGSATVRIIDKQEGDFIKLGYSRPTKTNRRVLTSAELLSAIDEAVVPTSQAVGGDDLVTTQPAETTREDTGESPPTTI